MPWTARPIFNFSKADLSAIHQQKDELLRDIKLLLSSSLTDYLWKFLKKDLEISEIKFSRAKRKS